MSSALQISTNCRILLKEKAWGRAEGQHFLWILISLAQKWQGQDLKDTGGISSLGCRDFSESSEVATFPSAGRTNEGHKGADTAKLVHGSLEFIPKKDVCFLVTSRALSVQLYS